MVSIFFGIRQQSLLLPYPWTTGILFAFVVWNIVLKLVLQLHKHNVIRKGLYNSFSHYITLKDCAKAKVWFIWKYIVPVQFCSLFLSFRHKLQNDSNWEWNEAKYVFKDNVTTYLVISLVSTGSDNEDELPVLSDFSGNVNWVSSLYSDLKVEIYHP